MCSVRHLLLTIARRKYVSSRNGCCQRRAASALLGTGSCCMTSLELAVQVALRMCLNWIWQNLTGEPGVIEHTILYIHTLYI